DVEGRPLPGPIPRAALQLRIPGVSGARRPGHGLPPPRWPEDRGRADGGVHDGSRGVGVGARPPSSSGTLLRGLSAGTRNVRASARVSSNREEAMFWPVAIVVLSTVVYHVAQKSIP